MSPTSEPNLKRILASSTDGLFLKTQNLENFNLFLGTLIPFWEL